MLNCPFCQADLARFDEFPANCPSCSKSLMFSDEGRASVQLLSDSMQPPSRELDATIESLDSLEAAPPRPDATLAESDDIKLSKTFVSDEWDDASGGQTVPSIEDLNSREDADLVARSSPSDVGGTIEADSVVDSAVDDAVDKTLQSEEFALDDVVPGGNVADRTVGSEQWENEVGHSLPKRLHADAIPQDAIKTMQTMWSEAFQGRTTPGMTVKGKSFGVDGGKSTLVIKERSLCSPGEQNPAGIAPEYELIKVLGEGGMGVVYDAKQMSVDRSVAVKMLKPKTAGDEKQRQKFLAEAVVTGELDHPNIVPIYDVGTSERGLLFYSMKKVKGIPWMKLIQQKSIPENLDTLMKVADAVAFAHSRGVIHRDLKPENVMIGDFGEVLVMDWGLALPAPGYNKSDTISPAHSMGGTPAYMAPEMASGPLEKISFSSDVYLLGAILYEILTGRAPHTGKNTMQCLFAAAKNEIRPAEKKGELMDIALKAMATDPKLRHQDVRAFQDAIREYRTHIESIALSTSAAEELARAEKLDDYQAYSRAMFGFSEALKQWDENPRAKAGLSDARLKYAASALRKGDYDLGISLLDQAVPEHHNLHVLLKAAQTERDARQQRLKFLNRAAKTLVAMVIVGGTVAFFWIKGERDRADEEREKAVVANNRAQIERDNAFAAKAAADIARQQEALAKTRALQQKEIAQQQEQRANKARDKALAEEEKARIAQGEAEDARHKEEYEAYIARIGLAAAKIDENAFDSARELLRGCKSELQNWEWGRLMYLCDLSGRSVDAKAPIDAVAFSADGTRFITGGWNGSAQIWETATRKPLLTIPYNGLYVHAVAFSPDGKYVALGGNDKRGFIRVCDAQTGEVLKTSADFAGHKDAVLSVAFSHDGKKLLTASYDKTACLWDVESGRQILELNGHSWWVWSAAFAPDEQSIVTASQDGSAALWNATTGERLKQFLGHEGPVYSAAFSPDGKQVVSGGYDTRVLLWRPTELEKFDFAKVASGKELDRVRFRALDGHGGPVRSVSFSADGTLVLSGSHDNTVKVWDRASGRTVNTFRGHDSWVRSCKFSPDGRTVVSAGKDHRATLWTTAEYEEVRLLQGFVLDAHRDAVLSAAFNRDGQNIVTASRDRSAKTWDLATGRELQTFEEGHRFLASNAAFFPDGKRLLTAAADNTVRFWDMTTGTELAVLKNTGRSAALALSHDGKFILTGSGENKGTEQRPERTARLWDVKSRELVAELAGHTAEVTAVAFSSDDKWFFTGDSKGRGILWNSATREPQRRLKSHTGKITGAAFLPDGSRILTASNDNTVAQWDVATGEELAPLILKHPDAVVSMALVPESRQVLTCCADRSVRLWDIDTAQPVGTLPVDEETNIVAVSPDGRLALTVHSKSRTARLWELALRREIKAPQRDGVGAFLEVKRTRSMLWTAAFSPDGNSILTVGGSDARLWDVQKGIERMSFSPNGIVASAGFSPDGSRIVTGSWDNAARVWDVATGNAVLKLEGHEGSVNGATYSPDGSLIVTASDDSTAILWDAERGTIVRTLRGHTDRLQSAVFSPAGTQILTAAHDKTARLWDAATGEPRGQFAGHEWAVLCAAFSPDGKKVITGSEDNSARIWETATQKLLLRLEGHTAPVASVTFLPDEHHPQATRVLTGSRDNTAKLWDAEHGSGNDARAKEILTLKRHSQEVTCVSASPNGRFVVTSSRDGTAIVWLATDWTKKPPGLARRND